MSLIDGLDLKREKKLRSAFELFDKNNEGFITLQNLKDALSQFGITATNKDVEMMVKNGDTSGDGNIDFEGFVKIFLKKDHTEKKIEKGPKRIELNDELFRNQFDNDSSDYDEDEESEFEEEYFGTRRGAPIRIVACFLCTIFLVCIICVFPFMFICLPCMCYIAFQPLFSENENAFRRSKIDFTNYGAME